ncbi:MULTISPECIES: restriction endonuclease subunit S [Vibrio]|uniref:restriction endonuclease subunit S n=1 Tax=Vibrio TaxID=662 RepID=UPI0013C2B54F|nr:MULTISPECIES: restriction endonuclease subunit S [Vibrio]ELJ8708885.1 restriction endonuclease subunit S [Vibrio cholerae]ELP1739352.1 restriction endonuclease subunit S [Vibrio cholerae]MCG6368750.1 restriction endonuclease subunit S [Vibrio fluvialis]MCG6377478.1 restriction endonuclease subunit S [Vibrio fluvialis]MDV2364574.1 restriction endonuclease subunit S [Vibrio cholerae]
MVKLTEVAEVNPRCPKDVDEDQLVSFVAMASASEEGLLLNEESRVLKDTKKGFTYFERGDVLLAKITPCFENGKSLRPYQISNKVGFGSTEFHVLRANMDKLDPTYLFYMVWNDAFRFIGTNAMAGAAGQKRVGTPFLKQLEIPLPPLAEQKRIAAILDKADAIRQKRKQAIELADEFLRSVFLDMFGDIPAQNSPYKLDGCRGYVKAASGKSSKNVISTEPTEIPIYGGNGINGYATMALYYEPVIVVGRVGQQCAITTMTNGPSWVTDNAIVLEVTDKEKFNPIYLAFALKHSPIRDSVTRLDLPFINQQMLLDYPIPHAPIALQDEFVDIREKMRVNLDRNIQSLDMLALNFNSLSKKAFSGQL